MTALRFILASFDTNFTGLHHVACTRTFCKHPQVVAAACPYLTMVLLDLLTIAGIPTAVGASEAVHQQQLLDEEAEAPERQEPFYLDVYCDAQSRKKDEVHGTMIVLKNGRVGQNHIRVLAVH